MSFSDVLVTFFNGTVIGSMYVLVALGVTLIYGILVIINFAHGDIFMLGAFFAVTLVVKYDLPYVLAGVITLLFCAVIYVVLYQLAFRKLRGFELGPLITSIGAGLFIQNLALLIYGGDPRVLPSPFIHKIISLGPLTFSLQRFLIIPAAFLSIAALYWFIERTSMGRSTRAVKQDPEVAALMGVNPNTIVLLVVAIAGVLVAIPAVLVAPIFYVYPLMGVTLTVKAYAIVVMGGFGNVTGTILAGMLVGMVEAVVAGFGYSQWVDSATFLVLIGFLAVRPQGLIPERVQENV